MRYFEAAPGERLRSGYADRSRRSEWSGCLAAMRAGRRGIERPTYSLERLRSAAGAGTVVGIDEAGMGPWAGPVVAAAVRLDPNAIPAGLDDSKILNPSQRQQRFEAIMQLASVGIGIADVARIDRDNILSASHWAMVEALRALRLAPGLALVDGRHAPDLGCPAEAIIGGDGSVASIAAASIVAKVTRDRIMMAYAATFPGYGFERHMGYGTVAHRLALDRLGVTPIHRRSFRPIADLLAGAVNP